MINSYIKKSPCSAAIDIACIVPIVQTGVGLSIAAYHTAMMVYELACASIVIGGSIVIAANNYNASSNEESINRPPDSNPKYRDFSFSILLCKEIKSLKNSFCCHLSEVNKGILRAIPILGTINAVEILYCNAEEYE